MRDKKINLISFNNRKKQFLIAYSSGKKVSIHYGQLGIRKNIKNAWVDKETRGKSIGIEFSDGNKDYLPYDQPLALVKDPEFLLQNDIEVLTAKIKTEIKRQKISKRYLADQLHTSDNQVQRL